jgi:uncharacterized protein
MTPRRAALLAALLVAALAAHAQPNNASDVAPSLRAGVAAYRAGDLAAAEAGLRGPAAGNPDAEAWLGAVLLDRGRPKEALAALQHSADAGSAEGAHRLGLLFAQGADGVPRDDAKALALFEKAAAAGHVRAQINAGTLYFRGQGTRRDLVRARAWFEKAAAKDDAYALYALGRAMDDSDGPAMADLTRAADLYRRAAQLGHPLAAMRYGLALAEGIGVRKDPASANAWLIYAEKSGVPEAALALGDMAVREKALKSAITWYEAAAQAGVARAQLKLANAYVFGIGIPRDAVQADRWYVRAANQGLLEAQHAFGLLLTSAGSGTPDSVEGYKWLLLAERGGFPDSKTARETLAEKLSEADRKRAEALAAKFAPHQERSSHDAPPRLGPPGRP